MVDSEHEYERPPISTELAEIMMGINQVCNNIFSIQRLADPFSNPEDVWEILRAEALSIAEIPGINTAWKDIVQEKLAELGFYDEIALPPVNHERDSLG